MKASGSRVAVIKDDFFDSHSTSWARVWVDYCKRNDVEFLFVSWRDPGVFGKLVEADLVLWHFSHYSHGEMLFARSLLNTLEKAGVRVFPSFPDSWHFDDKVAQAYLLDALDIRTPENYIFYRKDDLRSWVESEECNFPLVAKLRGGSGSANVKIIRNKSELLSYASKMFGFGIRSTPNIGLKVSSQIKSAKSFNDLFSRARRAPEFLFSYLNARQLPREKGYVYLQEFIPDNQFDLKVVVIGDKLSFIGRKIREGDFRASGGGSLFYDKDTISPAIIEAGFEVADRLGSDCCGMDFVMDKRNSTPCLLEISYGFSHEALSKAGGHFDRSGQWHSEPLNAPVEIIRNVLDDLQKGV